MHSTPRPPYSPFVSHWSLDESRVFLNHGSFGATPRRVLGEQCAWRDRMERDPVQFFVCDHHEALDATRLAIAAFVDCSWECIAPIPNATIGVATVFANVRLEPGDQVLTTSHEYPACMNNARRMGLAQGVDVVQAPLSLPIEGPQQVIESIASKVTSRTKLALISHITSPSGLVLPVREITRLLRARGVTVLIDGAHAPGMIEDLSLREIDADYYVANCHKWICSPKGSAFLYARRELRDAMRPFVLSNHAEIGKAGRAQFLTEFDYTGTQDFTPLYCIPQAITTMSAMCPGGFAEVMRRNRALCLEGRRIVCSALGVAPPAPEELIGSIGTILLPQHPPELRARLAQRNSLYGDALQDNLIERWGIQVPVWSLPGTPTGQGSPPGPRITRISAQLYNTAEQYAYFAGALREELERERVRG